jgi:hypothetical protein
MNSKKKEQKIRGFRPAMDEASSPSHDAHINGYVNKKKHSGANNFIRLLTVN